MLPPEATRGDGEAGPAGHWPRPADRALPAAPANPEGRSRKIPSDFVIFTRARSGSNSLMSRLDSCPDVTCHGEIFKRKRIDLRPEHRRRLPIATVPARNAGSDSLSVQVSITRRP